MLSLAERLNVLTEQEQKELKEKNNPAYKQNLIIQLLLDDIRKQKIFLLSGKETIIDYNQFHTSTRRLSDSGRGYNILTIAKDKRNIIPSNDFLLEVDYNAFEPRVALGLLGLEQPKNDIYSELFPSISREQAKKKMLVWMYGDNSSNDAINGLEKTKLINSSYDGEKIKTIFGRQIYCPKQNIISYLIQSTASDLILEKAYLINKFLKANKLKTKISYLVHDSIVFDIAKDEKIIVTYIAKFFSDTMFGKMKLNISFGNDSNNFQRI